MKHKQAWGQLIDAGKLEILKGDLPKEKKPPKKIYIRNHSQKVRRIVAEVESKNKIQRGWPENVTCDVCGEKIKASNAERRCGGAGMGRPGYYICKTHLEQKFV